MTRCAITGVEVPLDEAFALDLRAAYDKLRGLRAEMAAVERLIDTLAFTMMQIAGPPKREVRQRLTVSFGVAAALDTGAARGLFVPWQELLRRQSEQATQRMLRHPYYGAGLRALSDAQRLDAVTLGRQLLGRLTSRVGQVELDVRLAVSWGAATALLSTAPDDAIERLAQADAKGLPALGIPAPLVGVVTEALRRYREAAP